MMVPAGAREGENAVLKGTCRTQRAYESCLGNNLGSVPIQGNPPRAGSRLSSVDDPAQTVKNALTMSAPTQEFGVTIVHFGDRAPAQMPFIFTLLAAALRAQGPRLAHAADSPFRHAHDGAAADCSRRR